MKKIGTFDTIEGFWRFYVHLRRPSDIPKDTNYYLFRDGLFPAWESFPEGGCWILKVRKKPGVLSKLWQDLVFATIGECFEEPDVCGVMMAVRNRMDMISVWNATPQARYQIGAKLKKILHLDLGAVLDYKFHFNSLQDGSTFRNARPYVFAQKAKQGGDAQPPSAPGSEEAKNA